MKPRTFITPIHRSGRDARGRRGFTILEVLLAVSLSGIVILFSFGIFATIDRAHKLQEKRMDRAQELATLHRALSRAFTQLLMTDAPLPPGDDMKKKIETDVEKALVPGAAYERDADAGSARLAMQPVPGATWLETGGPVQTIEVTLRAAPILGGLEEVEGSEDETVISQQYALSSGDQARLNALRAAKQGSGSTSSRKSSGPTTKFLSSLKASGASGPLVDNVLTSSARDVDEDENATPEPARAPGLRGVFELRPETPEAPGAFADSEPTYAMWWRELPLPGANEPGLAADATGNSSTLRKDVREGRTLNNAQSEEAERLEGEARLSNTGGRQIKLIGGLKRASWKAFRQRSFVEKMAVKHDRELPAYMEFDFQTVDGRAEKWLFEVAWSKGPEPGTIVQAASDPLLGDSGVNPNLAQNPQNPGDPTKPNDPTGQGNKTNEDQFAKLEALLGKDKVDQIRRQVSGQGGAPK